MDRQKIIKIAVIVLIIIGGIIYYFSNRTSTTYEDILTNDVVVENKTTEVTEEDTKIKVYVTGEVNTPGVIELEEGARIQDAIEGAGGIKAEANLKDINLAYEVSDGEKIYIPNLAEANGDETAEEQISSESSSSGTSSSTSSSNEKININKATASELTTIPGVGESTAQKIIDYREQNGKFKTIEDIKNVSGIGDSKYEKMKEYISVK